MRKAGGIQPERVTKRLTNVNDADWTRYKWKGEWQRVERLRVDLKKSLCVGEKGRGGQTWNSLEFGNSSRKPKQLSRSRKSGREKKRSAEGSRIRARVSILKKVRSVKWLNNSSVFYLDLT